MSMAKWGEYAFLLGVIIAIIAGIAVVASGEPAGEALGSLAPIVAGVLFIIGIVVGLLNITDKEVTPFLVAAIAFLLTATVPWGLIPAIGEYIRQILIYTAAFVAPAAVIVALKAVFALAKKA